jgi:beta-alanine degradation protein BauB
MPMHKKVVYLAVLGVVCAAQSLLAQEPNSSQSLSIPAHHVKYKDLGGPQLGTVWGDSASGAHGSFLRLPKGFVSPAHLHTGDYSGVIVEGSVTNAEAGKQEVVLEPGSYYFQKGKADHVTKCIGSTDCLIYITQSKAFDFIPSKK